MINKLRGAALGMVAALALTVGACGSDSAATTETKAPAAGSAPAAGQATSAPSGGSDGSASAGSDPGRALADGKLTIVARDNTFEPKSLTFRAGQEVTLTLENKGAAVHYFQMVGVSDANGKVIKTRLLPGNQSDTISFTVNKTGTFDFYCEVHPAEMRGKATVQAAS